MAIGLQTNCASLLLVGLLVGMNVLFQVQAKSFVNNRVVAMEVLEETLVQQSTMKISELSALFTKHLSSSHTRTNTLAETERFDQPNDQANGDNFDVTVDLEQVISTTGPQFVGVTIDASMFRREWKDFDVHNKTVQNLAKALAPSWIRVGGSAADFFIFNATASTQADKVGDSEDIFLPRSEVVKPKEKNYTVTGKEWDNLNYFTQTAGWDLIFDVNEFWRKDGHWDPDNARKLLDYSQQRNYSIPHFQLGNEPNSYYHNFHFKISGAELASDMTRLQSLLSDYPLYRNSSIVGPDVTKVTKDSAKDYLQEFLSTGGQDVVSAVTLHHYYFNAADHGVKLSDFYDITILDTLKDELGIGTTVIHSLAPQHPVWLSETSSVSGGGLSGASDGYVAGFMWLDKLGLSALFGLKAVLRQSFVHGNYALISDVNYLPYPDYFLTVLHKRLVQGAVFNVTTSTEQVRVYASCANQASYPSTNQSSYPRGALTIYALNIRNTATSFNLTQFSDQSYDVYLLTPGDEHGLTSGYVALNGKKLELVNEDLPSITPSVQTGPISFPAYSFGFVVIPKAQVDACM